MAKIRIIKSNNYVGMENSDEHIYPVTVPEAVIDKDNIDLSTRLANLKTNLDELQGKYIMLEQYSRELNASIQDILSRLGVIQISIEEFEANLETLPNLEEKQKETDGKITKIEGKITEFETSIEGNQQAVTSMQEELSNATANINKIDTSITSLQNRVSELESKITITIPEPTADKAGQVLMIAEDGSIYWGAAVS